MYDITFLLQRRGATEMVLPSVRAGKTRLLLKLQFVALFVTFVTDCKFFAPVAGDGGER